jgi:N-methylhydantoinase B/oxoprolinase/acetone carboxylase alpha subunit
MPAKNKGKIGLSKCVQGFLEQVYGIDWEKAGKMPRYREREIQAEIRGYNKAQEQLRGLLELNGTPTAAKLAEARAEGQMRPEKRGNTYLWLS